MPPLAELAAAVTDLVLPSHCVGCGAGGAVLCRLCGPVPGTLRSRRLRGGLTVIASATYDGGVRQALLGWKERGHGALARPLATLLACSVEGVAEVVPQVSAARASGRLVLVPVPTSRRARRARGGDLLAALTRRAGARTGVRTAAGALALDREVRDSVGLNRRDRLLNLHGAFAARPDPRGRAALLVDDVLTSGATLGAAADALRAAGWPVAGAAVVAETPLHDAAT